MRSVKFQNVWHSYLDRASTKLNVNALLVLSLVCTLYLIVLWAEVIKQIFFLFSLNKKHQVKTMGKKGKIWTHDTFVPQIWITNMYIYAVD